MKIQMMVEGNADPVENRYVKLFGGRMIKVNEWHNFVFCDDNFELSVTEDANDLTSGAYDRFAKFMDELRVSGFDDKENLFIGSSWYSYIDNCTHTIFVRMVDDPEPVAWYRKIINFFSEVS